MLKDLDLADGEKIQLAAGFKKRLLAELSADAGFLAMLGVMDYSLLVSCVMSTAADFIVPVFEKENGDVADANAGVTAKYQGSLYHHLPRNW